MKIRKFFKIQKSKQPVELCDDELEKLKEIHKKARLAAILRAEADGGLEELMEQVLERVVGTNGT